MIKKTKYKILPAIKPSVAINAEYQKALLKLVRQMRDSISYYCLAAYKPIIAEIKQADKQDGIKDAKPTPSESMAKSPPLLISEDRLSRLEYISFKKHIWHKNCAKIVREHFLYQELGI